jgi:hypothetical protein
MNARKRHRVGRWEKSASWISVSPICAWISRSSWCRIASRESSRPSSAITSSVEGCTVSPRKSRRKSRCFSSTRVAMPARASRNPTITPAGPPPATQHRTRFTCPADSVSTLRPPESGEQLDQQAGPRSGPRERLDAADPVLRRLRARADVSGLRADQAVGPLLLEDVRGPAGDAAGGEDRGREAGGDGPSRGNGPTTGCRTGAQCLPPAARPRWTKRATDGTPSAFRMKSR